MYKEIEEKEMISTKNMSKFILPYNQYLMNLPSK
jgi:hypothetical protein